MQHQWMILSDKSMECRVCGLQRRYDPYQKLFIFSKRGEVIATYLPTELTNPFPCDAKKRKLTKEEIMAQLKEKFQKEREQNGVDQPPKTLKRVRRRNKKTTGDPTTKKPRNRKSRTRTRKSTGQDRKSKRSTRNDNQPQRKQRGTRKNKKTKEHE